MRCRFFVCYSMGPDGNGLQMRDTVVTIEVPECVEKLPEALKFAIGEGLESDGSRASGEGDNERVVLVHFQCLESMAAQMM